MSPLHVLPTALRRKKIRSANRPFFCLTLAVMVQGVLERVLNPDARDALYERATVTQYARELLFSSVFGLIDLVVCRIRPSIHAAYRDHKEEIET